MAKMLKNDHSMALDYHKARLVKTTKCNLCCNSLVVHWSDVLLQELFYPQPLHLVYLLLHFFKTFYTLLICSFGIQLFTYLILLFFNNNRCK